MERDGLIGEGFLGEAEAEVAKGKLVCKCFEARIMIVRTQCGPVGRTLLEASLLEAEPIVAVIALDFAKGVDGVYALKAARMC